MMNKENELNALRADFFSATTDQPRLNLLSLYQCQSVQISGKKNLKNFSILISQRLFGWGLIR